VTATICALLAAGMAAWIGTGLMRRYALRTSLLDLPDARRIHNRPTPRGGGAAIVIVTLSVVAAAGVLLVVPASVVQALVIGGGAVALVGWIDDRRGVPAPVRAGVHLAAAAWALAAADVGLSPVTFALAALWIVWSTNLYNFMDGIDGLAGIEAVSVGTLAGLMLFATGRADLALIPLVTAAASAGFLPWNWPPARVFMGDVGSGFLGFVFGTMAVVSDQWGSVPVVTWLMLLGVFVFDATVTLVRRVARRERWYQAHRSHAYQRLVQRGISPGKVGMAVLLFNGGAAGLAWIASVDNRLQPACLLAEVVALSMIYLAIERRVPMAAGEPPR
jgi:Fuc2NAc and GlcNAc transferase